MEITTTKAALKKEGFPAEHVDAFLSVAEDTNCVILTRTPGEACEMLLGQGYDAKGFFVKAKSCDWGPMAGFVCLDPLFNKSRIKGAHSNLDPALHSLRDKFENKTAGATQVVINQARLEWLLGRLKDKGTLMEQSDYYHYSSEKDGKFLLAKHPHKEGDKSETLWDLYYDVHDLYNLDVDNAQPAKLADLLTESMKQQIKEQEKYKGNPDKADKVIAEFWQLVADRQYLQLSAAQTTQLKKLNKAAYAHYAPVMAMTNPHPPFDGERKYLNALTGDYDLYAVWPTDPGDDDLRVSGMTEGLDDNVIVDRENANKIGQVVGNITNRLYLIGQLLNSAMAPPYGKSANRIFHSDEAGRPFVADADSAAAFAPDGKIYYIANAADLAILIEYCHNQGFTCFVNKGWEKGLLEANKDIGPMLSWSDSIYDTPKDDPKTKEDADTTKKDTANTAVTPKDDAKNKTAEKTEKEKQKDEEAALAKALTEFMKDVRGDIPKLVEKIGQKLGNIDKAAFSNSSDTAVFRLKIDSLTASDTTDYFRLNATQQEQLYDRIGFFKGLIVDHSQSELVQQGFREVFRRTVPAESDPTQAVRVFYKKPKFSGFYETAYSLSETNHQLQNDGVMNFGCALNIGAGGLTTKFGLHVGYNYGKESMKQESSHAKTVYVTSSFFLPKVELSFDTNRPCASPEFVQAVQTALNLDNDRDNRFFRLLTVLAEFGHFVPTRLVVGGRLYGTDKKTIKKSEEISDVTSKHSAALRMKLHTVGFQGDTKAEASSADREQSKDAVTNEAQNMQLQAIGGEGAFVSDPNQWTKSLADFTQWSLVRFDGLLPSIYLLPKDLQDKCKSTLLNFVDNHYIEDLLNYNAHFLFYNGYNELFGVRAKRNYFFIQNTATNRVLGIQGDKFFTGQEVEAEKTVEDRYSQQWWINAEGKILSKASEKTQEEYALCIVTDEKKKDKGDYLAVAVDGSTLNQHWAIGGGFILNLEEKVYLESHDEDKVTLSTARPNGRVGVWQFITTEQLEQIQLEANAGKKKPPKPVANGAHHLKSGETLNLDNFLLSPNGRYQFIFKRNGVILNELLDSELLDNELMHKKPPQKLWASDTHGEEIQSEAKLVLDASGSLVILKPTDNTILHALFTNSPGSRSTLDVQNNGNVQLLDADGHMVWETDTCCEFFCLKHKETGFVLTTYHVNEAPKLSVGQHLVLAPYIGGDHQLWLIDGNGQIMSKLKQDNKRMALACNQDGDLTLDSAKGRDLWDVSSLIQHRTSGKVLSGPLGDTAQGQRVNGRNKADGGDNAQKWEVLPKGNTGKPIYLRAADISNTEDMPNFIHTGPIELPDQGVFCGVALFKYGGNRMALRAFTRTSGGIGTHENKLWDEGGHFFEIGHNHGLRENPYYRALSPIDWTQEEIQIAKRGDICDYVFIHQSPMYLPDGGKLKHISLTERFRDGNHYTLALQSESASGNNTAWSRNHVNNSETRIQFDVNRGVGGLRFCTSRLYAEPDEVVVGVGLTKKDHCILPYLLLRKQ